MDLKVNLIRYVFYGALTAWVATYAWGDSKTLIGGTTPGLSFQPQPPADQAERNLIWYKSTKEEYYNYWKEELTKFLKVYKYPGLKPGGGQNIVNCAYDYPPRKGQVCDVDITQWSPCTEENNFDYHRSAPCIFLKLDEIVGWVPEYYNQTSNLPENMPAQLKEHIVNEAGRHNKYLNSVWISCEGVNQADIEHVGTITYYPKPSVPGYFYPYENVEGYVSPLVAIHLERPRNGVLINIECKAWAKNIIHEDGKGSVRIELMID